MEWTDEAIILSVRPHGETAAVVELLTRSMAGTARWCTAAVRDGCGRRCRSATTSMPPGRRGSPISSAMRAGTAPRLCRRGHAGPMARLAALRLTTLARLVADRDPHPNLYEVTLFVLGFLDDATVWPALYVRWEIALLGELGFGLDLTTCAATGARFDLHLRVAENRPGGVAHGGRALSRQAAAAAGVPHRRASRRGDARSRPRRSRDDRPLSRRSACWRRAR